MVGFNKLLSLLPLLPLVFGSPVASAAGTAKRSVPSGFAYAEGTNFMVDGQPWCFGGMNAYWIPQLVTDAQYTQAFDMLQSLNAKVLRTWAFSMVEAVPSTTLTYYQLWNGTNFSVNTGANGLERMDKTVAMAEQYGIKLILTFTNNWDDYGGMDTYTNQTTGSLNYHSDFYIKDAAIQAYESYVQTIVNRYKDSPAIFAWELANEPRANGWPTNAAPDFTVADLTKWISDRAAFVKSLDPNHMVAIGDEGYYNWQNTTDYVYDGGSGLDFEANLKIADIDFGTFHLYPQSWGETPTLEWGLNYIEQHANSMNEVGKPVLFEEFNLEGWPEQLTTMTSWIQKAEEVGLPGIMPWGLGAQDMDISGTTVYYNGNVGNLSGMDIYPSKTQLWDVLQAMGTYMPAKCAGGAAATSTTPVDTATATATTSDVPPVSSTTSNPLTSDTVAPVSTATATATGCAASTVTVTSPGGTVTVTVTSGSAPATSTSAAACTVAKWGQCGGLSYSGCTSCVAGTTCTYANDWYSQCL